MDRSSRLRIGVLAVHLDLATQMHQEGAVTNLADHDARHTAHCLDQSLGVVGVARGARHVDPQPLLPRGGYIKGSHGSAGLLYSRRQLADRSSPRWNIQPHGDRVRDGGNGCHGADPLTAKVAFRKAQRSPAWLGAAAALATFAAHCPMSPLLTATARRSGKRSGVHAKAGTPSAASAAACSWS